MSCVIKNDNTCGICKVTGKDNCENNPLLTEFEAKQLLYLLSSLSNESDFMRKGLEKMKNNFWIY